MRERERSRVEGGEEVNRAAYLKRIAVDDADLEPNFSTLRSLHRGHLLNVPFENLDIHWKNPIVLNTEKFFEKIVSNRRGGFCYELNGLFNELLTDIGFATRLISARVFNGTTHGPEFDHAAIIVTIDGDEYLADVGFGSFTAEPLRFTLDVEQRDPVGTFVIRRREDGYHEVMKREDGVWRSEYIFLDIGRDLSEFSEKCEYQQYSPESHFTKGKLCSIMTASGRKTLTDKNFIVTREGVKDESPITSDEEFYETLGREFGIARTPRAVADN